MNAVGPRRCRVCPSVLTDMKMWENLYEKIPFIASVARDLLPIQPTQTAAERIFNRTKSFNVGRESTKPERVEKYCMSAMNVRALAKAYPGYRGTNVAEGAEGSVDGPDGAGADDGAKDVSDDDTL